MGNEKAEAGGINVSRLKPANQMDIVSANPKFTRRISPQTFIKFEPLFQLRYLERHGRGTIASLGQRPRWEMSPK